MSTRGGTAIWLAAPQPLPDRGAIATPDPEQGSQLPLVPRAWGTAIRAAAPQTLCLTGATATPDPEQGRLLPLVHQPGGLSFPEPHAKLGAHALGRPEQGMLIGKGASFPQGCTHPQGVGER